MMTPEEFIKLVPEFQSGNSIPVQRATMSKERFAELLNQYVNEIEKGEVQTSLK